MTTSTQTIGNALLIAKEAITQMIAQGLGDAKHVYGITMMIAEKFELTEDQSLVVVEEALKLV